MTGLLLIILTLADLLYGVVLLPIVWLGSIVTIFYRLILWYYGAYQGDDLLRAVVMAVIFFSIFWLLWKLTGGKGMADGDMYVAMYLGLVMGWPKGVVALLGSFILGAVVGLVLIITKLRSRKDTLPFVPFMVGSMIINLLWGDQLIHFLY